ncbi:hypothetical protein NDU88_000030 [Pleurodeles waltl]|uniref:Uncharacterized protein n=1 Tax=Pleurodeles waltl TaxID=8319 RepID=A0AAV7UPC9_PLEWA|nr:hypothetical protein NDU88_000030 [Pleurodeles waltl]
MQTLRYSERRPDHGAQKGCRGRVGECAVMQLAPVDYRQRKQNNAKVGECAVMRLAPVDYRQRKQNTAKVSDGLLSGVLFL